MRRPFPSRFLPGSSIGSRADRVRRTRKAGSSRGNIPVACSRCFRAYPEGVKRGVTQREAESHRFARQARQCRSAAPLHLYERFVFAHGNTPAFGKGFEYAPALVEHFRSQFTGLGVSIHEKILTSKPHRSRRQGSFRPGGVQGGEPIATQNRQARTSTRIPAGVIVGPAGHVEVEFVPENEAAAPRRLKVVIVPIAAPRGFGDKRAPVRPQRYPYACGISRRPLSRGTRRPVGRRVLHLGVRLPSG